VVPLQLAARAVRLQGEFRRGFSLRNSSPSNDTMKIPVSSRASLVNGEENRSTLGRISVVVESQSQESIKSQVGDFGNLQPARRIVIRRASRWIAIDRRKVGAFRFLADRQASRSHTPDDFQKRRARRNSSIRLLEIVHSGGKRHAGTPDVEASADEYGSHASTSMRDPRVSRKLTVYRDAAWKRNRLFGTSVR